MNARNQIKGFEGLRLTSYLCSEGVPTIGYGSTGPGIRLGMTWTQKQADDAFEVDYSRAERDALMAFPWFADMNPPRKAAVVGMVFQLGLAGVQKFRNMLSAIRDERWPDAEAQALDSLWAKQTPKRARLVARQLATGEWQT